MQPVSVVYDNRPRLSDAVGDLSATLSAQDKAGDQQAMQQALAVMHYMTQKGATPQQWAQTRAQIQQSNPDVARFIPDIQSWDPTAEDQLDQLKTKLQTESGQRIQNGTATKADYMMMMNPKSFGTEGGLQNQMFDTLGPNPGRPAPPSTVTDTSAPGTLSSIISGGAAPPSGGQATMVQPGDTSGTDLTPPPVTQAQLDAARTKFGLNPNAYQQGQLTERNRHDVATEGETKRFDTGKLGFERQRTGAYVAKSGAQQGQAVARTEYINQSMDPNSALTQTRLLLKTAGTKANDPVSKYAWQDVSNKLKSGDALMAKAANPKLSKAEADAYEASARLMYAAANDTRTRIMSRTETGGPAFQNPPAQEGAPTQGGSFIMDRSGKVTPIGTPSVPSGAGSSQPDTGDEEDDTDEEQ